MEETEPPRIPRSVMHRIEPYITDDEEPVLACHQHVVILWKPALIALLGTLVWISAVFRGGMTDGAAAGTLTLIVLALWVNLGWHDFERRHNVFIATEKRLLKVLGFFKEDVPMLRLSKVTDMRYSRSIPGKLLGYGSITIESAGQQEAIKDLSYMVHPQDTYIRLCQVLFDETPRSRTRRRPPRLFRRQDQAADVPQEAPKKEREFHGQARRSGAELHPATPRFPTFDGDTFPSFEGDEYRFQPSHRDPTGGTTSPDTVYRSSDLLDADRRADTGEIPRSLDERD